MVGKPLVRHLLKVPDFHVTLADVDEQKAEHILQNDPKGSVKRLDVTNPLALKKEVAANDIVVSLVPYTFHPLIARACIMERRSMVTTSYVSKDIRSLDAEARESDILLLNETGLDPGIDHMSAMKIIRQIEEQNGRILSFRSHCGGLPSPEANTNPMGYKLSWSPRGVALAGTNNARYLQDGNIVEVPNAMLFSHKWNLGIDRIGTLQGYPNRDSIPYITLYGLEGIHTLVRGTLRYPGWCETWQFFVDLGYLDTQERDDLHGLTYRDLLVRQAGLKSTTDIKEALSKRLNKPPDHPILKNLEWLGLLSQNALPPHANTLLDILVDRMEEQMQYAPGERDMIVLQHEFIAVCDGGRKEKTTSTFIAFGQPGGDTAMALSVGLPAAIAVRLILENKIDERGVQIPVVPGIYQPILDELSGMGFSFEERKRRV